MLDSYLSYVGFYRWGFLVAAVGVLGCQSGNEITCPAVLEACPATLPTAGTPCAPRGSANLCEYGDDPSYYCNTFAYCDSQGAWYTVAPSGPDCPTIQQSGCPASYAETMSGGQNACASAPYGSLHCYYPEGYCSCTGAGLSCTAPAAADCPATRPHAGTACAAPCTTWGSGHCDGESMKCVCGTWQLIFCTE
jgi:hypothetical protein